jgi:esterase
MTERRVNGVNLYYEHHGEGAPIVLIHGCGGSALGFAEAVIELAELGRVIAYDRRGCARSERPEPYERTSVAEHTDDAAALLDALEATPAIVIGRSYGGTIAADLALRYHDRVRAVVMLEPDAPREMAPKAAGWIDALAESLRDIAARDGTDAVGEALITAVSGGDAWRSFSEQMSAAAVSGLADRGRSHAPDPRLASCLSRRRRAESCGKSRREPSPLWPPAR